MFILTQTQSIIGFRFSPFLCGCYFRQRYGIGNIILCRIRFGFTAYCFLCGNIFRCSCITVMHIAVSKGRYRVQNRRFTICSHCNGSRIAACRTWRIFMHIINNHFTALVILRQILKINKIAAIGGYHFFFSVVYAAITQCHINIIMQICIAAVWPEFLNLDITGIELIGYIQSPIIIYRCLISHHLSLVNLESISRIVLVILQQLIISVSPLVCACIRVLGGLIPVFHIVSCVCRIDKGCISCRTALFGKRQVNAVGNTVFTALIDISDIARS